VRCRNKACGKQKSLKRLRKEINIIVGFYQQQQAYRVATDLGLDYQLVSRVSKRLSGAIYHPWDFQIPLPDVS
jgi:hypothetical protein